jgi:hypothetical protein
MQTAGRATLEGKVHAAARTPAAARRFRAATPGVRSKLQRWLGLTETLDYDGVRHALSVWKSHAGLIHSYLLLRASRTAVA